MFAHVSKNKKMLHLFPVFLARLLLKTFAQCGILSYLPCITKSDSGNCAEINLVYFIYCVFSW